MTETPPPPSSTPAGWYPAKGEPGMLRWWDGSTWTDDRRTNKPTQKPPQTIVTLQRNPYSAAALIFAICGFIFMGIPLFIGWVLGGIPDIIALILGSMGVIKSREMNGTGRTASALAVILALISLFSVFLGAGSIW